MESSVVAQLMSRDVSDRALPAAPVDRRRPTRADWVAVAVLLAAVPVVHDLGTMLTAPYWLDEAWVALSVRFPLAELPVATSSTPIGWTFLLRLVPDPDYLRVVTLAFHGLGLVGAYAWGRLLGWTTRRMGTVAGLVCATAVLLLPIQQIRHDLKQYTADAAVTVGLLALVSWTEKRWSYRRLGVVAGAVAVGMLFSHVTAIVAPCVFGSLLVVTAIRRQWSRFREVVMAAVGGAVAAAAIYLAISVRGRNEEMQEFWADSFPTLGELPGYLEQKMEDLTPWMGASGLVILGLFVAGVLTLAKQGRPVPATAVVLLPIAAVTLGVARVYPLLDMRTSHFLLVSTAAVGGLGAAGLARLVAALVHRVLPAARPTIVTTGVTAVLLASFAVHNGHWYRFNGNNPETYYTAIAVTDIRFATRYVADHRSRNDVVVMSNLAWYGFAYYSEHDPVELTTPYGNAVGWWVAMPTRSDVVVVPGRDAAAIRTGLDDALRLAGRRGGARIWLIRSHVTDAELEAWRSVLVDYHVEEVTAGVEPVALIREK